MDKKVVEIIDTNDNVEATVSKKSTIHESVGGITGYVTVIKNKGRADEQVLCKDKKNLLTTVGRDDIHDGLYANAGSGQAPFNFMALSVDTHTPVVGDTILLGEIVSGGLERIQASTRTHTATQNTTLVEHQFTATAIHTAVQLSGLFDAISTGTLGHENTFTPASLQINDTLTVSWTITAG